MAYYNNMLVSNNIVTVNISSPQSTFDPDQSVYAGQIWKDNHPSKTNRLILVLYSDWKCAVCQNLKTGKITAVRKSQFHRGKTGYSFVAKLSDLNEEQFRNTLRNLTQSYGDSLTKWGGRAFSITIRQETR